MESPAEITYGPIFIGVVLNIVLYGIMITQTFLYFTVYKRDKIWLKLYVVLLFLCDTLNSAFDLAFLYIPLISKFGNNSSLQYASWIFATDPAMTSIIALLVQIFFAWRVKVLTNNTPIVVLIALSSIAQWCGGMGTAIAVGLIPEFVHFQKFKVIVIIWLACSAIADTIITMALVWHLRKHRTGFSSTDDVLNRIIRLTVQTGLITAICAIIDLVAFLSTPSGLHLIFNLPLSKLYTNSLMSSLNSRAGWKFGTTTPKSGDSSRGAHSSVIPGTGHGAHHLSTQQVFIDVESHEMVDVEKVSTEKVYAVPAKTKSFGEKRTSITISVPPRSKT